MKHYQYIIIWAGPAGSVLWSYLKQQWVDNICIIEKDIFPRHHIGESLQPDVVKVFDTLGLDRDLLSRFPKKYGAIYKWGKYQERWSVLYDKILDTAWEKGETIDISHTIEYGYNVDRKFFDKILLDSFLWNWGELIYHSVNDIEIEWDTITGLILENHERITGDFIIDASGQNSILAQKFWLKTYDTLFKNSAIYGYYSGYTWLDSLLGKDFQYIETLGDCWYWWIPVSYDLVSVGIVYNSARKYTQKDYFSRVQETEIWSSIEWSVFSDSIGNPTDKCYHISDWSFISKRLFGSNWCLLGDAAGFVDPILSGGVSFAMEKAIFLWKLLRLFPQLSEYQRKELFSAYERKYKSDIINYLKMAHAWYEQGNAKQTWIELSWGKTWFIDSISWGKRFFEQNKIFQEWQNQKIMSKLMRE